MILETELLGRITIPEEDVITLPEGLLGFPEQKHYIIATLLDYPHFSCLQCVDDPDISFIAVDPRMIIEDYQLVLSDADKQDLQLQDINTALILVMVVLHPDPQNITANLMGPIVINPDRKIGKQIVITNSQYSLKYKLYSQTAPKAG